MTFIETLPRTGMSPGGERAVFALEKETAEVGADGLDLLYDELPRFGFALEKDDGVSSTVAAIQQGDKLDTGGGAVHTTARWNKL